MWFRWEKLKTKEKKEDLDQDNNNNNKFKYETRKKNLKKTWPKQWNDIYFKKKVPYFQKKKYK